MKGANALLAILILLMAVSPCGDVSEIDACGKGAHSHFSTSSSDHEHVEDICTPFCSCACCSIPLSNNVVALNKLSDSDKSDVPLFQEVPFPPPTLAIWQPPKI